MMHSSPRGGVGCSALLGRILNLCSMQVAKIEVIIFCLTIRQCDKAIVADLFHVLVKVTRLNAK
jgi:hypothetical protein